MDKTAYITIKNGKEINTLSCTEGDNLLFVLSNNGYKIPSYCGGDGRCGKCKAEVNGRTTLLCKTFAENDQVIELVNNAYSDVSTSVLEGSCVLKGEPLLALDIGTTTLALALVDAYDNSITEIVTADNPQKKYGADVISRIKFCTENGVSELQKCLLDSVNLMVEALKSKYAFSEVKLMIVAGNTVMTHLFFGVDCSSIGSTPYLPSFTDSKALWGADLSLNSVLTVKSFPCVSGFFGGDLVSGVSILPESPDNKYNAFIDFGTNAEEALVSKDKIYCTSAAAGPCFEGANISCGMSAVSGAISSFSLKNSRPVFKTISDAPARGICGTGLIDIVAEFLNKFIIDETGLFSDEMDEFEIAPKVFVTQADIREFQTAKAAVKSAFEALIKKAGINYNDIDTLYLSGGFAGLLNIKSAVRSGLVPAELADKCKSLPNTSLLGAVAALNRNEGMPDIRLISEYIDLSSDAFFTERFIENMLF